MSASLEASLRLEISQYQASLAKAQGDLDRFKGELRAKGKTLGNDIFGGIGRFVAGGALILAGRQALVATVGIDRLTRGMEVLEGSASATSARMEELREAGRLPGLDFEQAVRGDIRLRSVGLSADLSKRSLVEMGNALSLAGGSASDLDGVILALTQIVSKGKVSAEEINQIAERVPQVRAVMKDIFGTADTEALQKMNMEAEVFIDRLIGGFSSLSRATAGLDEDLSDIGSSMNQITVAAGGPLVKQLVPAFRDLATTLSDNKTEIAAFGSYAAASIVGLIADTGRLLDLLKELGVAIHVIDKSKPTVRQGGGGGGFVRDFRRSELLASAEKREESKKAAPMVPEDTKSKKAAERDAERDAETLINAQERLNDLQRDQLPIAERMKEIQLQIALAGIAATQAQEDGKQLEVILAETRRVELQRELVSLQKKEMEEHSKVRAEITKKAKAKADEAKAKADEIKEVMKGRDGVREELADLRMRAQGHAKEADLLREAKRIQEQTGISEQLALAAAREIISLKEKAAALDNKSSASSGSGEKSGRKKIVSARDGTTFAKQSGRFGTLDDYYALQQKREVTLDERFATREARGGGAGLPIGQSTALVPVSNNSLSGRRPGGIPVAGRFGIDGGSLSDRATRAASQQDRTGEGPTGGATLEDVIKVLQAGLL